MPVQPTGMKNDKGVILSIGFVGNAEAFELVMPIVTESSTMDASNLCSDAIASFQGVPITQLQDIISSDVYISFVQAEGMVNGMIPARDSFDPTVFPGTRGVAPIPTSACALGVIYEEPDDAAIGAKIGIGKSFFSGISKTDVSGNTITPTLVANILTFMTALQTGFTSILDPGSNWYRCLNVPKPRAPGTNIVRTLVAEARGNIYTQKRRLVPR